MAGSSGKPLGRDRLGRLVYIGDWVDDAAMGYSGYVFSYFDWRDGSGRALCVSEAESGDAIDCELRSVIVDLEESPKLNNYKRYFADKWMLDQIVDIEYEICFSSSSCEGCPFCQFGKYLDESDFMPFVPWLLQEATQ